jgi:hypothetical protein
MVDSTSKPQVVFAQIRPPRNGDQGQVVEGMFIVADGVVTPTNRDGNPATDERGKTYTQKLRDGENPKLIASRLTTSLIFRRRRPPRFRRRPLAVSSPLSVW